MFRIVFCRLAVSAQSNEGDDGRVDDSGVSGSADEDLTAKFMRFVNETKQEWPLENRWPTPLLSPAAVVRAQVTHRYYEQRSKETSTTLNSDEVSLH